VFINIFTPGRKLFLTKTDFIQNDSYEDHVPVNEDYECDIVQEIRNSYDNKLDARGKQLLEFCVTTKMRILNGRVIGDLFGKYTDESQRYAVEKSISLHLLLGTCIEYFANKFMDNLQ
jgi:hypothetical protein